MYATIWLWARFAALVLLGAAVGLHTFDSMQTAALKALAGGGMGAACGLLFFIDRRPDARPFIAGGCGGLVFAALALLWFDTPSSSLVLLLIGLAVAALIAWGVLRI